MRNVEVSETVAPKRPRFFYGWIIVAVSSLADLVAFSAGNASFGVFLRPMSDSLGWSRTLLSGAATLQSIVNIIISPILGPLVDRYDPRFIMVTGTIVAAMSYNLMGNVTQPWEFYVLYTAATALGLHEVGSFVTNIVVSKWFVRMRGRALAFSSLGNQIGLVFVVPLVAYFVGNSGWRSAWGFLGWGLAILLIPPVVLFMRRTPEDMGLRPDGEPPVQPIPEHSGSALSRPAPSRSEEPQWGVRDALRARTTWLLVVATNMWSLAGSAFLVHQLPYFMDVGLSLQAASFVVAFNNLVTIVAKLFWGFAAEQVPPRYCLAACYFLRAAGILVLLIGSGFGRIYLYAVVSGLGIAFAPLSAQIWADYYGRRSVGAIRGAVAPFNVFSSLGGALFAAVAFDLTGSYEGAFGVFSAALFLGSILVYLAKPPGTPPRRVEEKAAESLQANT